MTTGTVTESARAVDDTDLPATLSGAETLDRASGSLSVSQSRKTVWTGEPAGRQDDNGAMRLGELAVRQVSNDAMNLNESASNVATTGGSAFELTEAGERKSLWEVTTREGPTEEEGVETNEGEGEGGGGTIASDHSMLVGASASGESSAIVYNGGPTLAPAPINMYLIFYGNWTGGDARIVANFVQSLSDSSDDSSRFAPNGGGYRRENADGGTGSTLAHNAAKEGSGRRLQ